MADLKTTKEERAKLRAMMQPGAHANALGLAPKAALMLLDDLDTIEAENAALRERCDAYRDRLERLAEDYGIKWSDQ